MKLRVALLAILFASVAYSQFITQLIVDSESSKTFETLYPNENSSLILVIRNTGELNARNISVSLESHSDITFYPSRFVIGEIERQGVVSVPIEVRGGGIDPSRVHSVVVSMNYTGFLFQGGYVAQEQSWSDTWVLPLNVSARKPILAMSVSEPEYGQPGGSTALGIVLENIGAGAARDVTLTIDPPDDIGISGEPIVSAYQLEPGEKLSSSFNLLISEDATKDLYNIPVLVTYTDMSEKNAYSKKAEASLRVKAPANLSLSNVRYDPFEVKAGQAATLSVRIENAGKGDAKNVEAVLDSPWGSQKSFVGLLKKDEDSSVAFLLLPDSEGTYALNITLFYDDDLGSHEVRKELTASVRRWEGAQLLIYLGAAIVILAAGAMLLLRRVKK